MKNKLLLLSLVVAAVLTGCTSAKKVPYVQEAETLPIDLLEQTHAAADPRIVPGDLLNILVTSTNMQAALLFNKGVMADAEGNVRSVSPNVTSSQNVDETQTNNYLVNSEGYIDFPILGKVHVAGLTKNQVIEKLQHEIWPEYMKEMPSIDVRVSNFRVSVIGEVQRPGVVRAPNERLNLFEALAMVGDLGIRGRRDNVLLIRTNYDGTREIVRMNLQDKNLLLSPYFQLQQNDIIYVEPNKSAANASWQMAPGVSAAIATVGGLSSLAGLVIGIINLTRDK
ncbi:MAG: polysaccharide biosynthesis/export family protein [Muribaculaceae bacterium]|nr:polysaccharide biosynthesis/export family protein [Muribaculaceae bacterium]